MGRIDLKVVTQPSDERHWYALRVRPQAEYTAAYMLEQRGAWCRVPTETHYRRRTHYVREKAEFAKPEVSSLIFAGFNGEPAWYWLLRNQLIIGVESMNGQPMRLDFGKLVEYFARTIDGRLVYGDDGPRILVQGRGLVRPPTMQRRTVTARKPKPANPMVEPKGRRAAFLAKFALDVPQPVRAAA